MEQEKDQPQSGAMNHGDDLLKVAGETKSNNQLHESNSVNEANLSEEVLSPSTTRKATKIYWLDRPKSIKNKLIMEGLTNDEKYYYSMDDFTKAISYTRFYKEYALYLKHEDEIRCEKQKNKALMEFKKFINSENPNNEVLSAEEIFKSKGKQLQRWIEIEKETGKELLIINEAEAMKSIKIGEAQTEYQFYEKWWEKIYNGEEMGAELLIKAESKFKELCEISCRDEQETAQKQKMKK